VILGSTGRNFAAGMSGGLAYLIDWDGDFQTRCNLEMVDIEPLQDSEEASQIKAMIHKHAELTGSLLAHRILSAWDEMQPRFLKVIPKDYKRMLQAFRDVEAAGLSGEEAVMAAFNINISDAIRVSGN